MNVLFFHTFVLYVNSFFIEDHQVKFFQDKKKMAKLSMNKLLKIFKYTVHDLRYKAGRYNTYVDNRRNYIQHQTMKGRV